MKRWFPLVYNTAILLGISGDLNIEDYEYLDNIHVENKEDINHRISHIRNYKWDNPSSTLSKIFLYLNTPEIYDIVNKDELLNKNWIPIFSHIYGDLSSPVDGLDFLYVNDMVTLITQRANPETVLAFINQDIVSITEDLMFWIISLGVDTSKISNNILNEFLNQLDIIDKEGKSNFYKEYGKHDLKIIIPTGYSFHDTYKKKIEKEKFS